jgi:hypothetical protein
MSLWKIVWWLIATLGVAGTVALAAGLFALGPQALVIAARAVREFFRVVLSYRIGCALLAAISVGIAVDYWRHSRDDAEFARRVAAFEAAQVARDNKVAQDTRELVWQEIANATAENAVIDKDVKEFTDAPPPPLPTTGDPYDIDPADRIRLCHIAGKTECGPERAQGVRAARRAAPHPGNRKLPEAGAGRAR